jgi:L-asparaginase II
MLATAVHKGEPAASYWLPEHPVQERIHLVLEELSGLALPQTVRGIDGCMVPNWAMPVSALARAFARFADGTGLSRSRAEACRRIIAACLAEPELVAGRGRACTEIMTALEGRALVKTGAEGVYVAALPEWGLGLALKIDDGARRASEVAVAATLAHMLPDKAGLLDGIVRQRLANWRGAEVGWLRPSGPLLAALERLR